LSLAAAPTEPSATAVPGDAAPRRAGLPAGVYVLGVTSAVLFGSFAYFGLRGKHTESELRASCPQGPCDSGAMRREYLAADISLGLAIVAGAAALVIALTDSPAPRAATQASEK
jgi:hypothetical protein